MPKYRMPIVATSFTEVEANNLEDAINQIYNGDPDTPGIDKSEVSSWEIDSYAPIEVDEEIISDKYGEVFICDIKDRSKY